MLPSDLPSTAAPHLYRYVQVERIRADFKRGIFSQEPQATLALYGPNCTTPNSLPCEGDSVKRPDNAPICTPTISDNGRPVGFITLRGGGLFVVDLAATPIKIVAEYGNDTIGANGCGGAFTGDAV